MAHVYCPLCLKSGNAHEEGNFLRCPECGLLFTRQESERKWQEQLRAAHRDIREGEGT